LVSRKFEGGDTALIAAGGSVIVWPEDVCIEQDDPLRVKDLQLYPFIKATCNFNRTNITK